MRVSAALYVLAAGLAPAAAATLGARGDQSVIVNDDLKVPGESPLELCDQDHAEDIVRITSVDLLPNPPKAYVMLLWLRISELTKYRHSGTELVIKALGTVSESIEDGAYIQLQVKYGLIRLISTKADLCDQIKNVDMECPIDEGPLSITKTVSLPAEIPPVSPNIPA